MSPGARDWFIPDPASVTVADCSMQQPLQRCINFWSPELCALQFILQSRDIFITHTWHLAPIFNDLWGKYYSITSLSFLQSYAWRKSHGSALNAVLSSDVLLWNQVLATTVAALLKSLLEWHLKEVMSLYFESHCDINVCSKWCCTTAGSELQILHILGIVSPLH